MRPACRDCRRRKINCDRKKPCQSCESSRLLCIYDLNVGSDLARCRKRASNMILAMQDRVSSLEKCITNLIQKTNAKSPSIHLQNELMPSDVTESASPIVQFISKGNVLSSNHFGLVSNVEGSKKCAGSQALMCLFSSKSISWLKNRCRFSKYLCASIEALPSIVNTVLNNSMTLWTSLKRQKPFEIIESNIPENFKFVFEVLECLYESSSILSFLCPRSVVWELFQKYFFGGTYLHDGDISSSDLLIMHMALSLCLSSINSHNKNKVGDFEVLKGKTSSDLMNLELRCFKSSLFYFEKVSLLCEGLSTIQGVAMLQMYVDIRFVERIGRSVVTAFVSLCQQLDLHRWESFQGTSEEEKQIRRNLWLYCQFCDIDRCYKIGTNPSINPQLCTTLSESDQCFSSVAINPLKREKSLIKQQSQLIENCVIRGFQYYYFFFILIHIRIKYKSFEKLFSFGANQNSQDETIQILDDLNKEMVQLRNLMEPEVKPRFYFERQHHRSQSYQFRSFYDDNEKSLSENNIILHMMHFTHLMIINRVPFVNGSFKTNTRAHEFGIVALESARTILHMLLDMKFDELSFFVLNFLVMDQCMAYLTLLAHQLSFPNDEKLGSDIKLLFAASKRFTELKIHASQPLDSPATSKFYAVDLVARLLLQCLVCFVEEHSGYDYRKHLEGLDNFLSQSNNDINELIEKEERSKYLKESDEGFHGKLKLSQDKIGATTEICDIFKSISQSDSTDFVKFQAHDLPCFFYEDKRTGIY
ncbi:uncharacterized protein PRCAT00006015001 [Priceomyces carsonii]|uniref:uncharacterized protein n=1 Tax=Priceomyces carsonii TaxID=28549 RepID=UPI002ED99655|nr:unnamed protein product [Priceomyces carsonii]